MVLPGDPRITSSATLAAWLRDAITSGRWKPGDLLPSERDLIERFDIGRGVVRRAIHALRSEGLIDLVRGEGWMVRQPEKRQVHRVQRGSRMVARMPSPQERQEYDIGEGVPVVVVTHSGRTTVYPADRWEFTFA